MPTEPDCPAPADLRRKTVLIAGAGNIGSHLAPLVAAAGVGAVRVADRDRVEAKNLGNQEYHPEDVGRAKAVAVAGRLRGLFPNVRIEALALDLEDVPLGYFEVDLVLGALDSRRARQVLVSEAAWPLGVPVIDGGVGQGLVGRVQVFIPGDHTACLECSWGPADYRHLAAEYPCAPGAAAAGPPTTAPAALGRFIAEQMTREALRVLAGPAPAASHETAFRLADRGAQPARLRRAPACRFDHGVVRDVLRLGKPFAVATARDLLAAVEEYAGLHCTLLECRRRLAGSDPFAGRWLAVERLRARAAAPLADFGFVPRDRLRPRAPGRGAWIVLDHPGTETPTWTPTT
jgi:molybdopterin/thiamine biosynthesis adenylyltransferase